MPQQLKQRALDILEQLKNKWIALGRGNQIRVASAALILLAAIIGAVYILARPEMTVLESNLDATTLHQVVNTLESNGIKTQIQNNTTSVLVPVRDLDKSRLIIASEPNIRTPMGATGYTYDDALNVGGMVPESTRNEMLKRARETTISSSIEQLYNVNSAQVMISVPDASPFMLRPQDMPRASVILDTNTQLTSRQIEAIAYHVSKSVENLQLENISIMDTNMVSLYQVGPEGLAGSMSAQAEVEFNRRQELENQVKVLLGPTYNVVEAVANLAWDWTGGHTEAISLELPVPNEAGVGVIDREILHNSSAEGTEPAMEPGVQSNNEVVTYPALGGGTTSAERSDIDRQYRYDETRTVTNLPATGRIDGNRSSFAVRVFLNRVYYEDVLRESGELDGTTWEDYKTDMMRAQVTVPIPIETIDLIRNATGVQNVVIEGYELPIFIPSETIVRPINQMLMAAVLLLLIALLAFGLIRRTQPDEITEIEPELSVEELLVSSSGEEDDTLAEIDYFSDSELKKQIDKFVEEKPEAAAQLLRNWLTEDWD